MELWITNDTLVDVQDVVSVRLGSFSGETVWEESLEIEVPANSSRVVARWRTDRISGSLDRYLSTLSTNGTFPRNRHFFAPIKDLLREPTRPKVEFAQTKEHELRVSLKADSYAYFVHLELPSESAYFSDNYFDLEPGERRTVILTDERRAPKPESVRVSWR